jgi:hypothetical protein
MAGIEDVLPGPMRSFFYGNAPAGSPLSYEALQTRRKIAEQLMGRRSPYPKNIGEGLTYIGEAIGDRMQMADLERREREQGEYEDKRLAALRGGNTETGVGGVPSAATPSTAPAGTIAAGGGPVAITPEPGTGREPFTFSATDVNPMDAAAVAPPPAASSTYRQAAVRPDPDRSKAVADMAYPGTLQGGAMKDVPPDLMLPNMMGGEVPRGNAGLQPIINAREFEPRDVVNPATGARVIAGQIPATSTLSAGGRAYGALPTEAEPGRLREMAQAGGAATPAAPAATAQAPGAMFSPVPQAQGAPIVVPGAQPAPPIGTRPPIAPNMAGTEVLTTIKPLDPGPEPQRPPPSNQMQLLQDAARDRNLSPATRAYAADRYKEMRDRQEADYVRHWTIWKQEQMKSRDPETALKLEHSQLANAEVRRKLEGEGWRPLTKEQMATLPKPAEGQVIWESRNGELRFGPAPPPTAEDKGKSKLQEKMGEHFAEQWKEGVTAGDDLQTITQMRALVNRVGTGPVAVAKQIAGRFGIKTEGLDDIQALNATINRVVPQQRVPGSGTTSDFDARMFQAAVPQMMNTPGGNALIMDTMEGLARNKLARAEIVGKVVSEQLTIGQGTQEMLKLQGEARAMSERIKAHIETTGGKLPEPAISSETESAAKNWLKNNPNHPRAPAVRRELGM